MKKTLVGAAIGLAASYVVYKMYQQGKLDGVCDSVNRFAGKTKRDLMTAVDAGKNQVEYLKDRAEYGVHKAKEKIDEVVDSHNK